MATTLLQRLISFLKDNAPGVITTWGSPGIPDIGETDWSGVTATEATVDEFANLTDGQLLMGKTGATGLSNPTTAPTLAAATGGSLAAGTHQLKYTYKNSFGETTASSAGSITFASGTTNKINVSALTVPGGVTSVKWYMSDAPGSSTLIFLTTNSGGAFSITTLPAGGGSSAPSSNTTASENHPVKGTLTGTNGVGVTNGPGSITLGLNPATGSDISAAAGVVSVTAVQHVPFSATGPTDNQIPRFNSTSGLAVWQDAISNVPASPTQKGIGFLSVVAVDPTNPIFVGDNDPRFTAPTPLTAGHIFVGNISNTATDVAMSGDATIDVGGTVTVGKINGVAVTGTPSSGKIPIATSSSAATWQTPPTTTSIQGIAVSSTAPTGGQGLVYNSGTTQYEPSAPTSNATQIRGVTVSTTAPIIQDMGLLYNTSTNQYEPRVVNTFVGARGVLTTTQSTPTATFTKIAFSTTTFDTSSFYNSSIPTKLTVPINGGGHYSISGVIGVSYTSTVAAGVKQVFVRVNNVDIYFFSTDDSDSPNGGISLPVSTMYFLSPGDYVEMVVYQATGVAMNAGSSTGNNSHLIIARVGF